MFTSPIDEIYKVLGQDMQYDSDIIAGNIEFLEESMEKFKETCKKQPEIWNQYEEVSGMKEDCDNVKIEYAWKEGFRAGVLAGIDVAGFLKKR